MMDGWGRDFDFECDVWRVSGTHSPGFTIEQMFYNVKYPPLDYGMEIGGNIDISCFFCIFASLIIGYFVK